MDNITIDATKNVPLVKFDPNGFLKIEGRSIPENASLFYAPLIRFADELNAPVVYFDISLEYMNTASTKQILMLLNTLDQNEKIGSVCLNWFYEEGDDDSIETAEAYEDSLRRIRFIYNEVAEVNCQKISCN